MASGGGNTAGFARSSAGRSASAARFGRRVLHAAADLRGDLGLEREVDEGVRQRHVARVPGDREVVDEQRRAFPRQHVADVRVQLHRLGDLAVPRLLQPHVARQQHVLEVRGVVGAHERLLAQQVLARGGQQPRIGRVQAVPAPLERGADRLARVVEHQDPAPVARVEERPPRRRAARPRAWRGRRCRSCPRSTAPSARCRGRRPCRESAGRGCRSAAAPRGRAAAAGPGRAAPAASSPRGTRRRSRRFRPAASRAAPRSSRRGPGSP